MAKKISFISPVVTLVWPKLNEPDVYTPKKGPQKVRYVTDAELTNPDLEKLQKYLTSLAAKHLPDVEKPKLPFKIDKKTEKVLLTASSGVKYKPPVFDARNKRLPDDVIIGGGTKAKLDLNVNFFEISNENSGINLYINAVQVLELVESSYGKSNFDATDGYAYTGDGSDDSPFEGGHSTVADLDDDDPISF